MKKFLLVVVLIVVALYAASAKYAIKSGKSPDGAFHVLLVNKANGEITKVWGK